MKTYLFALAALFFAASCGNSAQNKIEGKDSQAVASGEGINLAVDTQASFIKWQGSKPAGAGSHDGTISIKEGTLTINGSELVSGSFVIDMNSIADKDLTDTAMNKMLVDHLKSADFFDVEKYPEAYFAITGIEAVSGRDSITHTVSGNLKMKDIEKNITFDAVISKEGNVYKAVTLPFAIDRTQWNVQFGSKTIFANLKDQIINDEIELPQMVIITKEK